MNARVVLRTGALALLLSLLLAGCDDHNDEGADSGVPGSVDVAPCGNAKVDKGELCDTAIASGRAGECPTSCPVDDACQPMLLVGQGCQIQCVAKSITEAVHGDGCCPAGIGPEADDDCSVCGDGVVSESETCDPPGTCPGAEDCLRVSGCLTAVFTGGAAACNAHCLLDLVAECKDADDCCPTGCSVATDTDCPADCDADAGDSCETP